MNWGMLGHEWAVDLLRQHVARGETRHAYLITGPRGIGRRTLALRFTQALNCTQPLAPGEPCRSCRVCIQIDRMQHPDLEVVQSEQEGGTIKVDRIRGIQHNLALHPYEARYRVALLLRFEEANLNAMNALLKTLEEPAPQVVLVLTAESAESLLPTIVSRCELLQLRPVSLNRVSQELHSSWNIPQEKAEVLAHVSCGRPGYAIHLHQDPHRFEQRQIWIEEHDRLLIANRAVRFSFAENIAKDKDILRSLVLVWLSYWRDIFLKAVGTETPISNIDRALTIERLAALFGAQVATRVVAELEQIPILLDRNINTRLVMEVLMLDLPRMREEEAV
jgi:DNA polymerase-3 subunit delta'